MYDFTTLYSDPAVYRDDERDADADGLSNWLESARGPGNNEWWAGFWAQDALKIKPWREESYCGGMRPGHFTERPFANLDLADPDVDGDTLLDGEDDQDSDDVINIIELFELVKDADGDGDGDWCLIPGGIVPTVTVSGEVRPVNAFNPCVPNPSSRSCPPYIPF